MLGDYRNLPRAVYLLCLGTFINRAGSFIVPFLTIYMSDVLHTGVAFAPVAFGVFGVGSICGSLIGGQLADRIGRRAVMLGALSGSAAILVLLSQITNSTAFLGGIFLFATVSDTFRPAVQAMIADVTTPAQRSHAFALIYVSINLGFAIGPVVGGIVAKYSFTWLFIADAATCAIYAFIVLIGISESLHRRGRGAEGLIAEEEASVDESLLPKPISPSAIMPAHDAADEARPATFGQAFAHMRLNSVFLAMCGATLFISLLYNQAMSTFPLYLKSLGMGPDQYGRIIAVNGGLIVLGQFAITNWMKGRHRGRLLVIAALTTALGFGLKPFASTEWMFMGTVVIWTLGEMMQAPLVPPIIAEIAPEHMRGRYMGVFSMCFSGTGTIAAPIGGLVLATLGPMALWIGGAGLAVVAAGFYATVRHRVAHPDAASATPQSESNR